MKGFSNGGPDVYKSRSIPSIDATRPTNVGERTPQEQRQAEIAQLRADIIAGKRASMRGEVRKMRDATPGRTNQEDVRISQPTAYKMRNDEIARERTTEATARAARRRLKAMGMTPKTPNYNSADDMAVSAARMMMSPANPQ